MARISKRKLAKEVLDIGKKLQKALSSSSNELLILLEKAENTLTKVGQEPPEVIQLALVPVMGALKTNEIMRHTDVNIQIAAACCFTELTRISAPSCPYDDPIMTEFFQLCFIVLKHLSSESGRNYDRAQRMLETVARLRSSVILLDIEGHELVVEMFELFFSTIRLDHPSDTFKYMEKIMSVVIEESDKISFKLLRPLLESVKMDNKNISQISWELGNAVFRNCSDILRRPLKKAVRAKDLDVGDYAEIVASLCQGPPHKKNMVVKEGGSTDGIPKSGELFIDEPDDVTPNAKSADKRVPKRKKKDMMNRQNDLESSSRGKLLKTKGMKKDSDIQKRTGKRGIAESSTVTEKMDVGSVGKTGSRGKDESSFLDLRESEEIKNDIFLKKHESNDEDRRSRSYLGSGKDLINLRIKVWWPDDREYYPGTVVSFDHVTKKHKIEYDDGDEEILFMDEETWEPFDDQQIQQVLFSDSNKHDTDPPAPARQPIKKQKKKEKSKPGPSKKQKTSLASVRSKTEKANDLKAGEVSITGVKDEANKEMAELNVPAKTENHGN